MIGRALPTHESTIAWFGNKPVSRAKVLAWEARRTAMALRRFGRTAAAGKLDAQRAWLVEAKVALGRDGIERQLLREVAWSDRLTGALARASGKHRRVSQIELVAAGCTAEQLPAWYFARAEADDETAFLQACPDHHLFRGTTCRNVQEVWETTGGSPIASRFFVTLDETDGLITPADPSYPVQMAGTARLADGTVIGGIRHQFRNEGDGLRARLTVELPWLIGPLAPAAHRWHLACEFSLWIEATCAREA
ncbi:MAG: hypothetical protein JWN04_6929 [Myxococcaceae bacterium]|nr:hypothetical protein [Myxococcaceae bacterium]